MLLLDEGEKDAVDAGGRPEILARLTWTESKLVVDKQARNRFIHGWCAANLDWNGYALIVGRPVRVMSKIAWPRKLRSMADCDDIVYHFVPKAEGPAARTWAAMRARIRTWQIGLAIRRCDHAFFASRRDRSLFDERRSSLLPNVVRCGAIPAKPADAPARVLCVGTMWYPPNRHGIESFLDQCWPAIAAQCPGLVLRIVGAASVDARRRWEAVDRVEAPGHVPDLRAEYARALFTVAPIYYGSGSCIKFLEAGSFGRVCVTTPFVASAYGDDFRDGESTLVARDAPDMVRKCVMIAGDARTRDEIAQRARSIVAERYTIDRFQHTVCGAAKRLLAGDELRVATTAR
jgi:glycosyltransferase involved in cell wall biosynthesis